MYVENRINNPFLTYKLSSISHLPTDTTIPHSTAENISVFAWNSLKSILPEPQMLYEVKIEETDKNVAIYRGEEE